MEKFKGLTIQDWLNLEMDEALFFKMKDDAKVKALANILEADLGKVKDNNYYIELYLYFLKNYIDETKGLKDISLALSESIQTPERLIFLINLRRETMHALLKKAELIS